jgi:putative ABC transport system substrate-binding protein
MGGGLHSRRQFLQGGMALVGLALLSGCGRSLPLTQPPTKLHRIGIISPDSPENVASTVAQILQTLAGFGYVEGQNLAVERRFGVSEAQLPPVTSELIATGVDLLLPLGTPAALAAKAATTTIPIVVGSSDPVGAGLVESLARPGGNVTGIYNFVPDLAGKRLQFLREAVPGVDRIAFLTNPNNPTYASQEKELQAAATALGVGLQRLEARDPAALGPVFRAATDGQAEALVVLSDSLILQPQRERICQLAIQHRLPTMVSDRIYVQAGGLISYGLSLSDQNRARAALVDKILRGAKPADLPLEGPTKFDLIINLKTAQALGLTIPKSVLEQATEFIQ